MNRRTTVKGILALGALSIASFPVFKWFNIHKKPDLNFLNSQKMLIEELSEMIIPATDTPGAKDAKVGEFIIKMMLNCTDIKNQNIFIDGLIDVEKYSKNHFQKTFKDCNYQEKVQVMSHFEDKAYSTIAIINKVEGKFLGQPFFGQLKDLTVIGYCTSEIGATQGLAYDYIPGNYESCVKLKPHQKSWATK